MPHIELVHDRAGSGAPIVLLHGIGHRRAAWAPVFDRLARTHDVIAPDLAGFGESAPYPKGTAYNMENACADLAANFAAWGIEKPHVVGNSLGGAIALELGARGLVSSVTALSPAGFFGPVDRFQALIPLGLMRLLAQVTPERVLEVIAGHEVGRRLIGSMLYAHPERATAEATYGDSLALKHARGFTQTARSGITYVFDADVPVPTTIAWGTKDRLLPYRQARTARKRLPEAHHVALVGAGHVPMMDAAGTIVDIINETVARSASSASSASVAPGGQESVA
ncbi:alpha/beta hydrolase [Nocardioides sp. AE5]|uniref:alpha/beta fold hydrolase n=1 Tax=Nocardioides sp. AE5 TaxID=2962573 RepID=UPI002881BDEC|nr:alpha/beta hydrolase [Nocardioides sp. AE5]MDT0203763.1 alpha/beta hydrolase [Nocardioides sp. AE5]